jgi:glycosyltransferase involved in cell wall biosynthesis
MQLPVYESLFIKYNACVLVPTYNNAQVLGEVLRKLLHYTSRVLVVNDGSTDNTIQIINSLPEIQLISYPANKGKGFALRKGFKEAYELGYEYVITIDSDGQHYPEDLDKFLLQLEQTPGALIVGARNMNQENVPGKSSFGNRFSNFWYWVNTGIKLPDTQSGYRLYPLNKLASKKYFTRKYEFEIEVLVLAAWSSIPVISIPVSVYYPKAEERITHFRPFRDFTRISVLNTFLVLTTFLWIKPRNFFKMLATKEGWRTLWQLLFIHPEESSLKKATSVGFGVFMGIVPIWGFQLAVGIPLSILFRLNKTLFLIAANISIGPMAAVFITLSIVTGKWLLGYERWTFAWSDISFSQLAEQGTAFFLGGTVLAVTLGLLAFVLTYTILFFIRRRRLSRQTN